MLPCQEHYWFSTQLRWNNQKGFFFLSAQRSMIAFIAAIKEIAKKDGCNKIGTHTGTDSLEW